MGKLANLVPIYVLMELSGVSINVYLLMTVKMEQFGTQHI